MFEEAVIFATKAHAGQKRKGTDIPFIIHPLEVSSIVAAMTHDEQMITAAVLHDVLEDCSHISRNDILQAFGKRVTALVAQESEDKSKSWVERKGRTIEFLKKEASRNAKIIALGDKLANIRSMARDYEEIGDELWNRFNMKDKDMQAWYYRGLIAGFEELKEYREYREYCDLVRQVFGE